MLFSMDEPEEGISNASQTPTVPALVPSHSIPDVRSQQAQLDLESHQNRLSLENKIKKDTNTTATYSRQLNRYIDWWGKDQDRRAAEALRQGSLWIKQDAHPITPLKAAIFLEYDTNRPKVRF